MELIDIIVGIGQIDVGIAIDTNVTAALSPSLRFSMNQIHTTFINNRRSSSTTAPLNSNSS